MCNRLFILAVILNVQCLFVTDSVYYSTVTYGRQESYTYPVSTQHCEAITDIEAGHENYLNFADVVKSDKNKNTVLDDYMEIKASNITMDIHQQMVNNSGMHPGPAVGNDEGIDTPGGNTYVKLMDDSVGIQQQMVNNSGMHPGPAEGNGQGMDKENVLQTDTQGGNTYIKLMNDSVGIQQQIQK